MGLRFYEMYGRIETYHSALGQRRAFDSPEQRMQSVRDLSLGLMMELAELVDSVPWKPWRPVGAQPEDLDNATREVVDIIFFLVAICEDLEITPEMIEAKFRTVLANNYARIKTGYSQDPRKGGDVDGR